MRLYSRAIVAVLLLCVGSVFSATIDPLWAAGDRGPDPSLITPQCVDGGDCNMCKFYDWLINRQNCGEDVVILHSTYCKRTDDYFTSLSSLGQEYVTAVKACHIKYLIPYYGTSAGTCSAIENTAQLSWFGLTGGATLSCLFQQGLLCDVIQNDADLEILWLIMEECATPASEAIINFIRQLARDKCDATASSNLDQFVNDKFDAPDPDVDPWTDAPAVDPWTDAPAVDPWTAPPVDPWTAPPVDPWTDAPANADPWPTTRKPNRGRPNRPNRPNKGNNNKRPNKRRPNKKRPNKKRPNKKRPNKRRPNGKPQNNGNRNPPPSNYNLHYWK